MVSAFCIGWAIHSYRAYLEQQTLYESVQMNSESNSIIMRKRGFQRYYNNRIHGIVNFFL